MEDIVTPRPAASPAASVNDRSSGKISETWWRTQSATMALLKHAYRKIGDAEAELARREARIRTLEKLALTDELTGLYNRRGFLAEFRRDMKRMQRLGEEGGLLILLDLNKFKQINDCHGHLAGDKALQLISRTLLKLIRDTDTVARLGGDEFVLFLSNTAENDGQEKAIQIRETLNSLFLKSQGRKIPLETSMGIAYCKTGTDFETVYDLADAALYADKNLP
ncbi:MAG: GGDEF domain-containing protein [Micavibrio sp.]|nr:MAG: GGDEF domain-containing protein [Micavibrio sp.]